MKIILNGITCGNNKFLAMSGTGHSSGVIMPSSDGITWSSRLKSGSSQIYGALYRDNTFVIVGRNG